MHLSKANFLYIGLITFLLSGNLSAAVLFSDDFETDSSSWTCASGELSKWSDGYGACGSTSGFGAEWKMGAGRNGGNAVYAWKNSSVPNGYRSASDKWLTGSAVSQEIYHRWYMKVPVAADFNKATSEGFKFWRYIGRENGFSDPPEIYLNVHGTTFAGGNLAIYNVSSGYLDLAPIGNFNDNQWHCHELRIKWNDNGQSNGVIEYWLDGVKKTSYTNISLGSVASMKTYKIGLGVGNVSDSSWYQSAWSAIAFDDIVVSTEYVGASSAAESSAASIISDASAPVVTITTSNNQSITSNSLSVAGTSSDNVGVSACKWRIGSAPNANNGTVCAGTSSFLCSTSGYSTGSNVVYVGCGDASGNWGSSAISVSYKSSTSSGVSIPAPAGFKVSSR